MYSAIMYLKAQLPWNVVISPDRLEGEGLLLQRAISIRLLEELSSRKATEDHGYFVALTTLDSIGDAIVRQDSGDVLFPVVFSCVTFKPFEGEILQGVVDRVLKHGVFLSCGPVEVVYVSVHKSPAYHYVPGENPMFLNDKHSRIEKGVKIRFTVLGTKWSEANRLFQIIASIEGDYLGPVPE